MSTVNTSGADGAADAKSTSRKNSTTQAPMAGLGDIVDFIRKIHEQGLERAPMPKVAEGTGYASPTSTSFYRRMLAARLFGLVSNRGADLTNLGQDCIKPTSEDATRDALINAIRNVPAYLELIDQYNGKRMNGDILSNWFERSLSLNGMAAAACSKAFTDSLRFAGALSADNQLNFGSPPPQSARESSASVEPSPQSSPSLSSSTSEGYRFELILDSRNQRKFIIFSPPSVTPSELKRIQDWLGLQLIVAAADESQ